MSYTNVYPSRINWENEPSIASPINATNLNKIDYAVYEHDQTFETWDVTKANQSDLLLSVKSIDYDTETGVFVFTWQNGTTKTVDLNIEKIPVSFSMDANGIITMTTDDGTTYTADVGSLIKTYTFSDSSEIDFETTTDSSGNKTVTASIKNGSIVGAKLEPNYLANCQSAANSASGSATAADGSAEDSEAWAVGTRDGVPVPSTDPAYNNNSRYWAEHTSNSLAGLSDTNITSPTDGQALVYNSLTQKWENADQSAGGGSKITVTTSESTLYGEDVTLTQGQTTLTATFSGSGVAVFEGVTLTGNVTLTATDGSSTSTRTLNIPYFGNYDVTMAFFSATITVTYTSGATCTISDGTTTLTATSNPMVFDIPNTGTWTTTCTLDGISAPAQSKVITTDGQSETITIQFGTINLTYDNEFRGLTITATDGVSTIQKTAPSASNTMVLYPNATGTWVISATYSGVTYTSSATVSSLSTPVSATLQSFTIYGFKIESTESDPSSNISYAVQYEGENVENYNYTPAYMDYTNNSFNYGSWENAFFMPRPCMLKNNGTVDYYLNPNDYSKKADGTVSDVANTSYGGNAMMEWGKDGRKIWYKIVPDSTNNGATVYISDEQVDSGFHAYSFIGSDGTTLNDHFYTPIYNGSVVNSKLRSISSQNIMNNVAGGTEITYATANGTGYYIETFADRILINLLLMLIGKSTNTQATFGNGHYTGGSQASHLLKSGTMNDKGLFYGTNGTGVGVKVFGMENYWGNQWRRTAGYLNVSGTQKYKLTAPYNDSGSNYTTLSNGTPDGTTGGYLSKMIYTEDGAMVSKTASGSNSTFYTDVFHFNNSQTDYAVVGGASDSSLGCGAFSFNLGNGLSAAAWSYGAALSYHA